MFQITTMHRLLLVLVVAILALFVHSIECRPHAEHVEFDCRGQVDGYYADLSDRAAFFSCYEESLVAKVVCEEGFEFDGIESCVEVQDNADTEEVQEQEISELVKRISALNLDQDEADEDGVSEYGPYRNTTSTPKLVYNIEITKNIFPKSLIVIGRMNREQKNK